MGFQSVSDLSKILFLFPLPTLCSSEWSLLGRLKLKSISLPKSFPFHHLHFHLCSCAAPGAHCCWRSFLLSKSTLFGWDWEQKKSASHQVFFWVWFAGRVLFLRGWVCLLAGDISSAFIFCCHEFGLEASPSSWQLLAACCKNMIN